MKTAAEFASRYKIILIQLIEWFGLSLTAIVVPDFVKESITHGFSVTQEHTSVGFVEYWVIHVRVTSAQRTLHHDHLSIKYALHWLQ